MVMASRTRSAVGPVSRSSRVLSIANATSGREFNATVVAAVLTIIGFSINDKIVIFDRIREDLKLGARGSFKEVINQDSPTSCIHVPMLDTTVAIQSARNTDSRRGLHADASLRGSSTG